MRAAFGSFGRGLARQRQASNARRSHRGPSRHRTLHSLHSKHQRYKSTLRVAGTCRYAKPARPSASHARKLSAGPPSGPAARSPFQRRQYHSSKAPQGAARALAGATSAWRGCSMTQWNRTRRQVSNAKVGDRVRATLREAVRRRGRVRTAFGSFGRGNARLATLGNVIASRNVRPLHSKHQRYKVPSFGW